MKVRTVTEFNDFKAKKKRVVGEEFVINKGRYKEITDYEKQTGYHLIEKV